MSKVRIGIIGFGAMGRGHAQYLAKGEVPGAELAAVCDISPESLKWAKENLGEKVQTFTAPAQLFAAKCCNAIIIAAQHYEHPPLAIESFKHDCHVLTEKPAGVYAKQVREMNEHARRSQKVFGIMFQKRTTGTLRKLRELVQSGELGQIRRTHYVCTSHYRTQAYYNSGGWRATWRGEGGGVLLNQAPHDLDIFQWIGGMPSRVRAFCKFGRDHDIEVEDNVTAYLEYPNGATGVFIASTGEFPGSSTIEIAGDRGRAEVQGDKVVFVRTRESVERFTRETQEAWSRPETWHVEISGGGGDKHRGITANWVDAILKGAPLLAPGEEGLNSVELANAMLLSSWTDDWASLPTDANLYYEKLQEKIHASRPKPKSL